MGYFSSVAFACSKKDYLALAKQIKEKGSDLFDKASETFDVLIDGEWWTLFRWESIRWFTTNEGIRIIENYMSDFDNKFQFIRLGENYEDPPEIINTTDECDWFGVYRTIEVNI